LARQKLRARYRGEEKYQPDWNQRSSEEKARLGWPISHILMMCLQLDEFPHPLEFRI